MPDEQDALRSLMAVGLVTAFGVTILLARQEQARKGRRLQVRPVLILATIFLIPPLTYALRVALGTEQILSWPAVQLLQVYFAWSELLLFVGLIWAGVRRQNPFATMMAILVLANAVHAGQTGANPLDQLAINIVMQVLGFDALLASLATAIHSRNRTHGVMEAHVERILRSR